MEKENLYIIAGMLGGWENILDIFVRRNNYGEAYVSGVYRSGEEKEELDDRMEEFSPEEIKSKFKIIPLNRDDFEKKING